MPHVLLVEDDPRIRGIVERGLGARGFDVTSAEDGTGGGELARTLDVDLVLLDLMLPGLPGLAVLEEIRAAKPRLPVIVLTALDDIGAKVGGLDAGADDYLTKPFSFKVLLARLRALARRRQVDPQTLLRIADLSLDPATYEVRRSGASVSLSRTEFVILEMLMRNPGRVITRARLIEAVWGHERDVQSNTLDVFIRQLRTKIEPAPSAKLLHTIRGVGYTLREEDGA